MGSGEGEARCFIKVTTTSAVTQHLPRVVVDEAGARAQPANRVTGLSDNNRTRQKKIFSIHQPFAWQAPLSRGNWP